MSNVTITRTGNPLFPYLVSSYCMSLAEADAKKSALIQINHAGFIPSPTETQTLMLVETDPATLYKTAFSRAINQDPEPFGRLEQDEAGWHFTDGGQSSQEIIFPETPELSPAMEALAELQDEEPPFRNPDAPVGEGEGE